MIRNFLKWTTKGKDFTSLTDEELLIHFKKTADEEVITLLFNRYIHLVYAACMRYFGNRDMAKDAAMEIFESLAPKLQKFEVGKFKPWLYSVTRNQCLMAIRKKNIVINDEARVISSSENMELSIEMHLFNEEAGIEQVIENSLSKLKEPQRICIELFYLHCMTYKDIAVSTGYTELEIKSHIQNGKRNLRVILESRNGKEIFEQ